MVMVLLWFTQRESRHPLTCAWEEIAVSLCSSFPDRLRPSPVGQPSLSSSSWGSTMENRRVPPKGREAYHVALNAKEPIYTHQIKNQNHWGAKLQRRRESVLHSVGSDATNTLQRRARTCSWATAQAIAGWEGSCRCGQLKDGVGFTVGSIGILMRERQNGQSLRRQCVWKAGERVCVKSRGQNEMWLWAGDCR